MTGRVIVHSRRVYLKIIRERPSISCRSEAVFNAPDISSVPIPENIP